MLSQPVDDDLESGTAQGHCCLIRMNVSCLLRGVIKKMTQTVKTGCRVRGMSVGFQTQAQLELTRMRDREMSRDVGIRRNWPRWYEHSQRLTNGLAGVFWALYTDVPYEMTRSNTTV
eukprot:3006414-Rhodomonas_salina.2